MPDPRRGINARDNTVRGKKKARNRLKVLELVCTRPASLVQESREEFNGKGIKGEKKLFHSFYELIKTLITRPVRNSTHTGSNTGRKKATLTRSIKHVEKKQPR